MISGLENRNGIVWDKPLPLLEHKDALPSFPVDSFSTEVGDYVKALAENTQTSIDMADVLLVAEPGERKSSIAENFLAEHGLKDYFRKAFIHSNNQEL